MNASHSSSNASSDPLWLPIPFIPSSGMSNTHLVLPPSLPLPQSTILLISVLLLLVSYKALYYLLYSPLAQFPGPLTGRYGPWFVVQFARQRLGQAILAEHQKHGRVVRIGPDILSVSAPEHVREIYRSHKLRKDPRLAKAQFGGVTNVFSVMDPIQHAKLIRLTGPAFKPSSLRRVEPELRDVLEHFATRVDRESSAGGAVDVWSLYRLLSFDMLGGACFGKSFGCMEMETGKVHPLVKDLDAFIVETVVQSIIPAPIYNLLKKIPIPQWQFIVNADQRLCDYGLDALRTHHSLYPSLRSPSECPDMLGQLRLATDPETGDRMSDLSIAGNLAVYILAGADTTPAELSFITWELARRPDVYSKLRTELEESMPLMTDGLDFRVLRDLPYLNAVIKEGLRRYPPVVMPMTRVVPKEGITLDGKFVPGGTHVAATAWTLHHDESVFPNAYAFIPERWLEQEGTEKREGSFIPFGVGIRACQGRLLAEMELYMTIATVVSRYSLKVDPSTTDESMREVELVTLGPKAHRCRIQFTPNPIQ